MKTLPTSSLLAGRIAMAGAALVMFVTFASPARAQESISDAEAARFLAQATFGPTLEDIAHLQPIGYTAWINEQFALPPSYELPYLDSLGPATVSNRSWTVHAWRRGGRTRSAGRIRSMPRDVHRDQLRQRVAFALSEIFVVSDQPDASRGALRRRELLRRAGARRLRQLPQPARGRDAAPGDGRSTCRCCGNQKPDPARNIRPDENFAREVLQLFTIGLVQLNPDGTPSSMPGQDRSRPTTRTR